MFFTDRRKSKKKQLGGASKINTPIFRCKLQYDNDTNDSELDKFYNNLFKVLLKEGSKNVQTSETITTTTETTEGDTKIVREKKTDLQNKICHKVAPSNDFTISPPKLKLNAPMKINIGPGIFLITFIYVYICVMGVCFKYIFSFFKTNFLKVYIRSWG